VASAALSSLEANDTKTVFGDRRKIHVKMMFVNSFFTERSRITNFLSAFLAGLDLKPKIVFVIGKLLQERGVAWRV
jgi:hypothetical protein